MTPRSTRPVRSFPARPHTRSERLGTHRDRNEGDGVTEEFDRLVEQFERFQEDSRRAENRLADYDGMRERIAELEATAHSPAAT